MPRILLPLVLGASLVCTPWSRAADSTNAAPQTPPPTNAPPNGPPPGEGEHHHGGMLDKILTPEEKAEVMKAHEEALAQNPSLEAEEKDLTDKMREAHESGAMPDPDLMEQGMEFRQKLHDAMVKADPPVAPILAKLEAAMPKFGGHQGPSVPPPSTNAPPKTSGT